MQRIVKKKGPVAAVLSFVLLAIIGSVSASAYAPDRKTYTCDSLASEPVFNSMLWEVDGKPKGCGGPIVVTDERDFTWIRECKAVNPSDLTQECKGSGSNPFNTSGVSVEAGKTYEVSVFYHNNAAASGNASGKSVMKDSKIKVLIPSVIDAKKSVNIVAELSGSNMKVHSPDGSTVIGNRVQDGVSLSSDTTVYLQWIKDSMRIDNSNIKPTKVVGGVTSVNPASVVSSAAITGTDTDGNVLKGAGALFGSNSLDGVVYGCTEYSGWIRFRVKAVAPGFTMQKDVAAHGSGDFKPDVVKGLKVGDKVDFKITYKNTGTMIQNSVKFRDSLPNGLEYVRGSAFIQRRYAPTDPPTGLHGPMEAINDDVILGGKDIVVDSAVYPGESVDVVFTAKVVKQSTDKCGTNSLRNIATVNASGEKSDDAKVEFNVECAPKECKPGIPEGDERCKPKCDDGTEAPDGDLSKCPTLPPVKPKCTIAGKTQYEADDPRCKEDELPRTGPIGIAFMMVSLAALGAGGVYWFKSHQALKMATAGAKSGGKAAAKQSVKKNAVQRTFDKVSKNVKKIVSKKK